MEGLFQKLFGQIRNAGRFFAGKEIPKNIRRDVDIRARICYTYLITEQEDKTMPKMKTSRSAAKRFSVTGSGKLVRFKANKSHILTKKTTKRKRNLRKETPVDETNVKNMRKIMPYI